MLKTNNNLTSEARRLPKQERSKAKFQRILNSATKLMAEHGVEGISTQQIAEHANVAIGTLYQFFPNVDAIKRTLIEYVIDQLYDNFKEALINAANRELNQLGDILIDTMLNFYGQRPEMVSIFMMSRSSESFINLNEQFNERVINAITTFIISQDSSKNEVKVRQNVRVSVMVGHGMTLLVWATTDPIERSVYIAEWRLIEANYLGLRLT